MMTYQWILRTGIGILIGLAVYEISILAEKRIVNKRGIEYRPSKYGVPAMIALAAICAAESVLAADWLQLAFLYPVLFALYTLSVTDLKYRKIPNPMLLVILLARVTTGLPSFLEGRMWLECVLGLAVGIIVFFLPLFFGANVGFGDIKLAGAVGFAFGLKFMLFCVCVMGILILVSEFIRSSLLVGKLADFFANLKRLIPLGPAFSMSVLIIQVIDCFMPIGGFFL